MANGPLAVGPLAVLLLGLAILPLIRSPKKLRTFGLMAAALVLTVLLAMILGAALRLGEPRAWGMLSGLVGLLAADVAGWWHTRRARRPRA
jgi:hypothetical protein